MNRAASTPTTLAPIPLPMQEYVYWASYLAPHDGDSPHMKIWLGMNIIYEGRIRCARINCPESSAPGGQAATDFTSEWMASAIANVHKHDALRPFRVQGRILDPHSRPLVEVWRTSDGQNLSEALFAAGHAAIYGPLVAVDREGMVR